MDYPHLPELLSHLRYLARHYETRRRVLDSCITDEEARRCRPQVLQDLKQQHANFDGQLASVTDIIKELQP